MISNSKYETQLRSTHQDKKNFEGYTVKEKGKKKGSVKKEFAQKLKASDLETKNTGRAKIFPDSYTSML